jgi:hypothetical protein
MDLVNVTQGMKEQKRRARWKWEAASATIEEFLKKDEEFLK